jgi:glycosyltransferase involved in cell wall biosynthesis
MAFFDEDCELLSQSIDSIVNQTFFDWELILISDNPLNFNGLELVKKYIKKDGRLKLIENKENIGLTKSLNRGLRICNGKYIARMDAGDISLPERIKKQFLFLENNKEIFLIGTGAIFVDAKDNEISRFSPEINANKLKNILEKKNRIIHSSIMFRNQGLEYREKFVYAQDYDFYLNLLSAGKKITNMVDFLIKYRVLDNSISDKKIKQQTVFKELAKKFYFQRSRGKKDDYDKIISSDILDLRNYYGFEKDAIINSIKNNLKKGQGNKARDEIKYLNIKFNLYFPILPYFFLSYFKKEKILFLLKFLRIT